MKAQRANNHSQHPDIYRECFFTYRPSIKVVDCTIRDGGLMNEWKFSDDFVRAVYQACVESGVDYMEIGYFSSENKFDRKKVGPWRFCADADIRRIVGENATPLKLSGMCDIGRIDLQDIVDKKDSLLSLIRIACYDYQIDEAISLGNACVDKGYEVSINLMAASKVSEAGIDKCLEKVAAESRAHYFYLVDSFGSLYGEQVRVLARKYVSKLPNMQIGFHGHNNQSCAFANTVDAVIEGINMVDGSISGLGRGAGNTCTEHLLTFLRNPKYKVRPIYKVIQEAMPELRKTIEWGISIPYLISGANNEHPRAAMEWEAQGKSKDGLGFYDKYVKSEDERSKPGDHNVGDPDLPLPPPNAPRVPNLNSDIYRKEFFTYRPMIKVIDNTIRDGGLMNNWRFDNGFVKAVYQACVAAGVDYMDIGYFTDEKSIDKSKVGPWRFCSDQHLREVVGDNKTHLKLAAMVDVGRVETQNIPHKRDTLIDMIRVSCYHNQIDGAIAIANDCVEKGFEVAILLMAVSCLNLSEIDVCLDKVAAQCGCHAFYLVDSYGSLYCEQVEFLMKRYMQKLPDRIIGFHGHNNMQMAFANSVQAICEGANMVDGSILGLGRAAGNTPLENLMVFLKNPKYQLRPVLQVIQSHVQPLSETLEWGESIPYLIAGARNEHPAKAMAWEAAGKRNDGVGFYDLMAADDKMQSWRVTKPDYSNSAQGRPEPRR